MPIDILANLKSTTNSVANRSVIGTILGNPIAIGVMIVLSLFVILYYFNNISLTFKFMFYTFIVIVGILIAHDVILKEQLSELWGTDKEDQMVKDVQNIKVDNPVQPRTDIDQIRTDHTNSLPAGQSFTLEDLQQM